MRILLVTESFAPRVDETADTARHLTDELLAAGHCVVVVTPGPGQASYRGAPVLRSRRLLPDHAVGTTLAQSAPDVLVAVTPRVLGNLALRTAARRGIPTVAIDPLPLLVRADTTLATCTSVRDQLATAGQDVILWRPGVDVSEHHPGLRDERRRQAWTRGERLVVGHVGEVGKEKVIDRLTKIAALDAVRLVVFGDGPGAGRLRTAGATVTGAMSGLELARGIASLDVLVQPRKKEAAVPGVRAALASGVPVVAFDAGGTSDVVRDGVNGLLTDPEHARSLRRAVRALAEDRDLRDHLAANARLSVLGRTWADAVGELVEQVPQPVLPLGA